MNFRSVLVLCLGFYFVEPTVSNQVLPDVLIATTLTKDQANKLELKGVPIEDVDGVDECNYNERKNDSFSFDISETKVYHRIHRIVANRTLYSSAIFRGDVRDVFFDETDECIYYVVSPFGYCHLFLRRCQATKFQVPEYIFVEKTSFSSFYGPRSADRSYDWFGQNVITVYTEADRSHPVTNTDVAIQSLKPSSLRIEKKLSLPRNVSFDSDDELNNPGTLTVDSDFNYIFFVTLRAIVRCNLLGLTEYCKKIYTSKEYILKMVADPEKHKLYFLAEGPRVDLVKLVEMDYDGNNLKELKRLPYNYQHESSPKNPSKETVFSGITSMFVHDDFFYWTDKIGALEKKSMAIFGTSLINGGENHVYFETEADWNIQWMKPIVPSGKQRKIRCDNSNACTSTEICLGSFMPKHGLSNYCLFQNWQLRTGNHGQLNDCAYHEFLPARHAPAKPDASTEPVLPDVLIADFLTHHLAFLLSEKEGVPFEDEYTSYQHYHRIHHIVGNKTLYSSPIMSGVSRDAFYDEIDDCIYYSVVKGRQVDISRRCKSSKYETVEKVFVEGHRAHRLGGLLGFDWISRNLILVHPGIPSVDLRPLNKTNAKAARFELELSLESEVVREASNKYAIGTLRVDSGSHYLFYAWKRHIVRCDFHALYKPESCQSIHKSAEFISKLDINPEEKKLYIVVGSGPFSTRHSYVRWYSVREMNYDGHHVEHLTKLPYDLYEAKGPKRFKYSNSDTQRQIEDFVRHYNERAREGITTMFVHDDVIYWTDKILLHDPRHYYQKIGSMGIFGKSLHKPDDQEPILFYTGNPGFKIQWMKTTVHSGKHLRNQCDPSACEDIEVCLSSFHPGRGWGNQCINPDTLQFREGGSLDFECDSDESVTEPLSDE